MVGVRWDRNHEGHLPNPNAQNGDSDTRSPRVVPLYGRIILCRLGAAIDEPRDDDYYSQPPTRFGMIY
jgi:hypothetical protein